jgi:AraC-like DNA-binding protein
MRGLSVYLGRGSPARYIRRREFLTDRNDDFALIVNLHGDCIAQQGGREVRVGRGEAVLIAHAEAADITHLENDFAYLVVPRAGLAPAVADVDGATMQVIPQSSDALRLLTAYLAVLGADEGISDPDTCDLLVSHIYDLLAVALGGKNDATAIAERRGLRATRISAIKAEIAIDPGVRISVLAARLKLSARYIQLLFEQEAGTTFTAYVRAERLKRAHRMLTEDRYASWTVSAIASEAGFSDLSHFNRDFRRSFGVSPSDVRAEAARNPK